MRVHFKTRGISYRCDTTWLSVIWFYFFMGRNNPKPINYGRKKQPNGITVKRFNNLCLSVYRVQNEERGMDRGAGNEHVG